MVSIKQTSVKKAKRDKIQKPTKIEKKKATEVVKKPAKKILKENVKEIVKAVTPVKASEAVKSSKKRKYVMPSKYITEELVVKCLSALQQLSENHKNKNTLLEDETVIFAEIHCMKIQNTSANIKLVLPHSTAASTGEVCLITPDLKKGRKIDHEPTVDHWEEILRQAGVTQVKTVLPVRQLKVEYDQFELKRRLMTQHDFIMVDTRVQSHVSHMLGKMFFKKHNMLIPVRINEKGDLKKQIDVGLRTVMLRLPEGTTSVVNIGHTGMSQKALKENILSLVDQLKVRYPGGEPNIRAINIKLPTSMSLPLYLSLRPSNAVNTPKLKQKKPKNFSILEDELTTLHDGVVRVAPDGTVKVRREQINKRNTSDTEEEAEDVEEMEEDEEKEKEEEPAEDSD
ncbi:ribosomal L1 domain-containing protein CG13096-like [Cydia fagiglandana]|uniref:ribosomal L1 domain-containing protein CG13096-like n=1 Tax=Cydia fagiglandana TaxID=1458189 RepID=UPI002FEE2E9C